MNKEQYLQKLRESLSGLRAEDAAEIMQYYTEYFEDAGQEHEAAVIGELGDPAVLAAQAIEALGQTQEADRNASRPLLPSLLGLLKGRGAAQGDPQSAYRFQEMDLEPFRSVFVHVRKGNDSDYRVSADTSNAAIYVNSEKRGKSCSAGYGTRKVILDTSNGRINITYKPALSTDTKA